MPSRRAVSEGSIQEEVLISAQRAPGSFPRVGCSELGLEGLAEAQQEDKRAGASQVEEQCGGEKTGGILGAPGPCLWAA